MRINFGYIGDCKKTFRDAADIYFGYSYSPTLAVKCQLITTPLPKTSFDKGQNSYTDEWDQSEYEIGAQTMIQGKEHNTFQSYI